MELVFWMEVNGSNALVGASAINAVNPFGGP